MRAHLRGRGALLCAAAGLGVGVTLGGGAGPARADYASTVLADNPSVYYRLNDPSGVSAVDDASPNSLDGAVQGTLNFGQASAFPSLGTAVGFPGNPSGGYVDIPSQAVGNWAGRTGSSFEVWFNTTASGVILGQNGPGNVDGGQPGGWVPALYVGNDGRLRSELFWKGAVDPETSPAAVNDSQWHHAAVVFDNGNRRLYLDGTQIASTTGGQSDYAPNAYQYHLGVGFDSSWPGGNGGWDRFNGLLDEAAFYQFALTEAQIDAHIAAAVPEPAAASLLVLGGAGLLARCRRRRV